MKLQKINQLLDEAKRLLREKEANKIPGDEFNLFSILDVESRENKTHSAFLSELLNPKGCHGMGPGFLSAFFDMLENCLGLDVNLEVDSADVTTEYSLGEIKENPPTGGRVDIRIYNKSGKSIAIENKIFAEDKEGQMVRYVNSLKDSIVIYLTLDGRTPSEKSSEELIAGVDFYTLSYRDNILGWLEECISLTSEYPVLCESIRQYINLIKKLTNTMEKDEEKKFIDLITSHYEESEYIADNFRQVKEQRFEKVRQSVVRELSKDEDFSEKLYIRKGSHIDKKCAQLWISHDQELKQHLLYFGVESFSGQSDHLDGDLFVGIFTKDAEKRKVFSDKHNIPKQESSGYWPRLRGVEPVDALTVNFGNPEFVKKLLQDEEFELAVVDSIVDSVKSFVDEYGEQVATFNIESNEV